MRNASLSLIAEVGSTCDGSVERACELIKASKEAGLDAIKFQCVSAEKLYASRDKPYSYQTAQGKALGSIYEMIRKMEFAKQEWATIFEHGRIVGIPVFATVDYLEGVDLLESLDCPAYKICAWDITYRELFEKCVATSKPLFVDVGPATWDELQNAREWSSAVKTTFLYAPHTNISVDMFNYCSGFSSPGRDSMWDAVALEYLCDVIEKRLTYDRHAKGHHHYISLEPQEMAEWVQTIRAAQAAWTRPAFQLSAQDEADRAAYYRSVYQDGIWKRP